LRQIKTLERIPIAKVCQVLRQFALTSPARRIAPGGMEFEVTGAAASARRLPATADLLDTLRQMGFTARQMGFTADAMKKSCRGRVRRESGAAIALVPDFP